jgi:hypothetical protein
MTKPMNTVTIVKKFRMKRCDWLFKARLDWLMLSVTEGGTLE